MHWVAYQQTVDGSKRCKLAEAARPGPPRSKFQGPAQPAALWGDGVYVLIWKTDDTRPRELHRDGPREWSESDPPMPGPTEPEREAETVAKAPQPAEPEPPAAPPPAPRAAPPAAPQPAPRAAPPAAPQPAPRAAPPGLTALPPVATLREESVLANLTVALGVLERLHAMAGQDSARTIAQIQAQAMVAIEAERTRCAASLGQTQEHWAALRALEREHRETIAAVQSAEQTRQIEVVEAQADEQAELADQVEELREALRQRAAPGQPSAWDRLQPIVEQLAPVVLPKVMAWLDGGAGGVRGSLGGDGSAGS